MAKCPPPCVPLLPSTSIRMAPPCRFYNTLGGCRKGTQCTFAHSPQAPSGSTAATTVKKTVASTTIGAIPTSSVPKGSCPFYWKTGDCTKGFKCRYKHEQDPATVRNQEDRRSGVNIPAALTPFLTASALSRLSAPGTDALFAPNTKARTPSEVHNLLKRFLYNDYRFRHALDVYAFASLLSDATSNNETWVSISCVSVYRDEISQQTLHCRALKMAK